MSGAFRNVVACTLVLGACGSGDGLLTVSPAELELVPGQTMTLVAHDEGGQTVAAEWTSSDPAKVTVSPSGLAAGIGVGPATVTASAGGRSGTAKATVREGGVVAATGGSLSALGGAVTLDIPAGAVDVPTAIAITVLALRPLDPRVVGGTEVTVAIGGPLTQPAVLSIAYDRARGPYGLPPGSLHLASLDGDGTEWTDMQASEDDPAAGRVRANLTGPGSHAARQADAPAPCTRPEDRQFDFWLGSWNDVFVGQGDATSEITRDAAGCNIFELFIGGATVGRSVSFFEPMSGKWYQTYVDNAGGRILLQGGLVNGRMVLATEGTMDIDRITWSRTGSGVRQLGESTRNGGATWTTTFDGSYRRRQ